MPELERLCRAWAAAPPPHVSLAMLLRVYTTWKPAEPSRPFRESTPSELAAFAASMGSLVQVEHH